MVRSLIPWSERLPRPISRLEEEMEDLFGRLFQGSGDWLIPTEGFLPPADVVETDKGFEVTVDLPGMKPDEVNVELKSGGLWISGKREEEKEEEGKTYHRIERRSGEFRRVVPVPETIDEEKVTAHFEDGVLKIVVPKNEEVKPKRIEVET